MASLTRILLTLALATSSVSGQSSTTVCTPTPCYQDNCYRNLAQSTAFCAAYTAPPVPGNTATVTLNAIQSSCGYSSLTSACSCLYPSGATVQATVPSITQCTTLPLAPSPTALAVDLETGSQSIYVVRTHTANFKGIISNSSLAHSPPNVFRVGFPAEAPLSFDTRNFDFFVTGLMRPFTQYTYTFWAKQDAKTDPSDASFDYINLLIQGLKQGPAPLDLIFTEARTTFSNSLLYPGLDTTWRRYQTTFNSGEYPYFYITCDFNNGGYSYSGVVPSVYIDDVSLVQS